jgi:isoquinoline 1-oxidoreductase subunit alpha
MAMKITVNGKSRDVEATPDTPLLWVLRDHLQMTGTKYGCGLALCGACTVHLDGQPVRSCSVPISTVGNKSVTTIEGLSKAGDHPLQKSWVKLDVPQCGYCQSGMLMSAAALLKQKPKPSDNDIDKAMGTQICRCGTYNRIRAAIHDAAGQSDASVRFMAWADDTQDLQACVGNCEHTGSAA